MADRMTFPPTFEEFIQEYEFIDKEEIYTNGSKLIPSFKVMQAWEHYIKPINNIKQSINNIYDCVRMIETNIYDIEESTDEIERYE